MTNSQTRDAKKYATIAEVAAAQAKISAGKLEGIPDYVEQAAASASAAASSAEVAVSAELIVRNLSISASESATSAAVSASQAGAAAEAAINRTVRVPDGESLTQLPSSQDRKNSVSTFDSIGNPSVKNLDEFALLDPDGKLPVSSIPSIALTKPFVVSNQGEMLGLDAQIGDIAKRTDLGYSFCLSAMPPFEISNWIQLTDNVLSQLGQKEGASMIGAVDESLSPSTVQIELNGKAQKTEVNNLADSLGNPNGASIYPQYQISRWRDTGDIRGWGAIEGTDCSDALQAAIKDRAVKHWGTSSTVIMNGPYRVDKKVLIPTDLRLIGNWASITSSLDDYIFESAYVDDSGELVSNWYLSDDEATAKARLKGTTITGITFVDCAKVMRFRNFNERCGLQDLYFERCGVAWEMVMPFYSFFNNIFIRSTKEGYEEWYACYLGRQSNLVDHFKVSITERKYGTLLGDIDTLPGKKNVFYEMISMRQCSWEHVNFPVTIEMDGYAFKVEDLYAEVISGPLFRIKSGDQYDMKIGSPIWLAGVENFGEFKGLKGRSEIFQGSQNDYKPSKPASILLEDSTCLVRAANENGYGNRINFDSSSTVELEFPVGERLNNVTNFKSITNSIGEVYENINKQNVVSVISGDVLISTKIKKSKHNMLVISIDLNNYDCGAVFIGSQQIKTYGYTLMIDNDIDGYTTVIIKNTGISGINEVIISGCIRYV